MESRGERRVGEGRGKERRWGGEEVGKGVGWGRGERKGEDQLVGGG